jgi:DNA-binding MarR family transcriptional regulator
MTRLLDRLEAKGLIERVATLKTGARSIST